MIDLPRLKGHLLRAGLIALVALTVGCGADGGDSSDGVDVDAAAESTESTAAVQEMVDAYNDADWEAFTATQRSDAPEWEPSECRFWFDIAPDFSGVLTAKITQHILEPCHRGYDSAMHAYGAWFDKTYPDEEPIQGRHYRAWTQPDETAGARAAAHLDEYLESGEVGHGDH